MSGGGVVDVEGSGVEVPDMGDDFLRVFNTVDPEESFRPVRINILLGSIRKNKGKRIVVRNAGDPDTELTRDFFRFGVFFFRKIN